MNIELSQQLARHDFGQALETGSIQVLDAERGTWACAVTVSGKRRLALCWNALHMILTPEEAQAFAQWTQQQQRIGVPQERSEDGRKNAGAVS